MPDTLFPPYGSDRRNCDRGFGLTNYRWFVGQALAGLEATAIYHLNRAGIAAHSPHAYLDGKPFRLFPGYVFVELAGVNEAGIVNRTRGMHKLLPIHASEPLPLPIGFLESLLARIARRELTELVAKDIVDKFVPDQSVVVKTGPFRDFSGKYLRTSKGSGVILGYLLGARRELTIPLSDLVPVAKPLGEPGARRVTLQAA